MFDNNFFNYKGFTSIPKGKLPLKFSMFNIKFYGIKNSYHLVRNFVSIITLKGTEQDLFRIFFPWKLDEGVMKWYNIVDPCKG